jgi:hypothetical protein
LHEGSHTDDERRADEIRKRARPFSHVGNGHTVGLHMADSPDSLPVVFLSHEEPANVTVLIGSLELFLADRERLGYVGTPRQWARDTAARADLQKWIPWMPCASMALTEAL